MTYSVLIVDDEPLAQLRLQKMLASMSDFELAGTADSATAAKRYFETESVDICLLDIHMPGISGIELASDLRMSAKQTQVIFCTAYDDHALDAFGLDAVDYLLKPIRLQRLQQALDKAVAQLIGMAAGHTENDVMVIVSGSDTFRLPWIDLMAFIAEDKYVVVKTRSKTHLINLTLKQLEAQYPDRLLRLHRNSLVNIAKVERLYRQANGYMVQLFDTPEPIAVSRRHVALVKERLESLNSTTD